MIGAIIVLVAVSKVPVARLVGSRRQTVVRALIGAAAVLLAVGLLGLVAAVGNPVTWAVEPARELGRGRQRPRPFRRARLEQPHGLVGRGMAGLSRQPGGGTGASTFEIARKRVRADAAERQCAAQRSAAASVGHRASRLSARHGVRRRRSLSGSRATLGRLDPDERAAAVGLVALPFAFGLHALVDFDLDFLAVAAPTMLVSAVAARRRAARCREGRPDRGARGRSWRRSPLLWVLVAPALSSRSVEAAYRREQTTASFDAAALRCTTRSAAESRSHPNRSMRERPLRRRPATPPRPRRSTSRRRDCSRRTPLRGTSSGCSGTSPGDLCGAYFALNAAYTLDPKSSLFYVGSELDRARDAVNDPTNPACGR